MRGTFAACLLAVCLVFQCSGSPMVTAKRPRRSTTSTTEVPITTQPSVSLLEIFRNESNSTPKKAAARNDSSESLFVTLKNRIHSYHNPKNAYDINHPAVNGMLSLKDKTHRYIVVTKKTPNTNQSSESPIVTRKNQSEDTKTAPNENQFVESPFITPKYQDYHNRSKEASQDGVHIQRNSQASALKHLRFLLQQLQLIDFDTVFQEYIENHLDYSVPAYV